jgi:hypothetical protein
MKLEDIVCSIEFSKKLFSLGIKRKSLFVWRKWANYSEDKKEPCWKVCQRKGSLNVYDTFSAFTASELGEMLTNICYTRKSKRNKGCWEGHIIKKCGDEVFIEENESNARAKMLIYLLENKLMEVT